MEEDKGTVGAVGEVLDGNKEKEEILEASG